jgi:HAE1 family hydrophobic/amphiphilic exporter-1
MTICVTLGTSLVISLAVIPLFTSKFLKTKVAGNEPKKDPWLIRKYAALLDRSLAHPVWTGLILLGLLGSIVIPAKQLEKFEGNAIKTSRLEMVYDFHDYFFLSEVEEVVNEVEAFLETYREEWGIDSIYSYLEESHAITLLSFTSESVPTDTFKAMRKTIREGLPRFGGVSFSFEDDAGDSDQALQVQLFGPDRSSLIEAGTQVIATLNSVEDLFDPKPVTPRGKKELRVVVDREKANRYGASPETISQIFGFTLGGTYLPRFSNGQKESDVTLGLRIQDRATMEDVSKLVIGNNVRLGSVIDFKYFDQPDTIERVNRKSYYAVKATYEGKAYAEMKKQVEARLNTLQFPTGVHWSWGEEMMREENEMGDLMFNIAIALILIYLVMASLFESLVQPLLIFSTIFFSLVGVFWFLFLTQTAFEVMTTIGLMLLLGIVVNNGIVMMDHINQLHRRGLEFREAVRQGAKERIRPILMTAGTTVFGMIPMAIGSSSIGDAYYFPLARCVIGGLTSSTLLTLIGLPSVLLGSQWLGQKMRSGGRWLWGKRPWQKSPSEVSA